MAGPQHSLLHAALFDCPKVRELTADNPGTATAPAAEPAKHAAPQAAASTDHVI